MLPVLSYPSGSLIATSCDAVCALNSQGVITRPQIESIGPRGVCPDAWMGGRVQLALIN